MSTAATVDAPVADAAVAAAPRRKAFGVAFWVAAAWLGAVTLGALLVDHLPIPKKNDPDFLLGATVGNGEWTKGFTHRHLLGVDDSGNDLLTYALHGARVSLVVGIGTVAVGLLLGGWLGMAAGYLRGRADSVITFVANAILSIPPLLFLLLLVAVVSAQSGSVTLPKFIFVLGVLSVPIFYRVVRAATLQQAQREYVIAASSLGATRRRILIREILPNVVKPTLAYGLVTVGTVIVVEGSLAFLGAGLNPSTISWGKMIQTGAGLLKLQAMPNATAVPATFIFLTVLSLNFIGDKVRERFEVKQAGI